MSAAQGLLSLLAASLSIGITTVTPQLIVPFAAQLAPDDQRGRVVGTVMSGLLAGILLARTFSGLIASWLGWRMVYILAAVLMMALMVTFQIVLPRSASAGPRMSYPDLLRSLLALLREEPMLRSSAFFGAMGFGAFSGFWTVLPFRLAEAPYRFGPGVVGLFALLGVSGVAVAPIAGRLADRGQSRRTIGWGLGVIFASYPLMAFTSAKIGLLIAGLILLDLGTTATHISNQARVYSVRPDARNRMTTIYMFLYFCGGACGSLASVQGWTYGGWTGFCVAAGSFAVVGLSVYAMTRDPQP
jgi:predicted MFS family arabinose efflux permease